MNAAVEGDAAYVKVLKDAAEKEKQFIDDFNATLVGVGNTGRPIATKSELIEALGGSLKSGSTLRRLTTTSMMKPS